MSHKDEIENITYAKQGQKALFNVSAQVCKVYECEKPLHFLPYKTYNCTLAEMYLKYCVTIRNAVKNLKKRDLDPLIRANYRIEEISNFLVIVAKNCNLGDYIDIGCGDGYITENIGKYCGFNMNSRKIYGVDIFPIANKNIVGIVAKGTDYYGDFSDGQFCLITLFVSLHHIAKDELGENIRQIKRILCVGGYLILREHDFEGNNKNPTAQFLNVIHIINLLDDLGDDDLVKYVLNINYKKETYWDGLLAPELMPIKKMSYSHNNVQHLYYKMYKKIGTGDLP